jgi:hypothetical protein
MCIDMQPRSKGLIERRERAESGREEKNKGLSKQASFSLLNKF